MSQFEATLPPSTVWGVLNQRRPNYGIRAAATAVMSGVFFGIGMSRHSLWVLVAWCLGFAAAINGLATLYRRTQSWRFSPSGRRTFSTQLVVMRVAPVIFLCTALVGYGTAQSLFGPPIDFRPPIPGVPGYMTYADNDGAVLIKGAPYGAPCLPIEFLLDGATLQEQSIFESIVVQARVSGVNVTMIDPPQTGIPDLYGVSTSVEPSEMQVQVVNEVPFPSQPRASGMNFDMSFKYVSTVRRIIAGLTFTIFAPSANLDPGSFAHMVRKVIGSSQGVAASDDSDSGITLAGHGSSFTRRDLSAMAQMSGCNYVANAVPST